MSRASLEVTFSSSLHSTCPSATLPFTALYRLQRLLHPSFARTAQPPASARAPLTPDVYPFPRFTVLPEHAAKSFLPLTNVLPGGRLVDFQPNVPEAERTGSPLPPALAPNTLDLSTSPHRQIQALITGLTANSVTFTTAKDGSFDDIDLLDPPADRVETIEFEYCVYALGGALSEPSDAWGDHERHGHRGRGSKAGGIAFLGRMGKVVEKANSIIVVGGGALGIRESSAGRALLHELPLAPLAPG